MLQSRRELIKSTAVFATASAAGVSLPGTAPHAANGTPDIRWDKAP